MVNLSFEGRCNKLKCPMAILSCFQCYSIDHGGILTIWAIYMHAANLALDV